MIHRSSVSQPWSQPYPHSAPPNQSHPRPLAAQYPHDSHNAYNAPALYPHIVNQQLPHKYSQPQPLPNTLISGGARPRARSTVADDNPFFEAPPPVPPFPSFPSPSTAQYTQGPPFPHIHAPPFKPPALQSQISGYPFPVASPTHDEVPIRPAPMSARRSSSSPALNRISAPNPPPPVPPLPPNYHSNYPRHPPQHVSPVPPLPPPPSIPIPSLNQPYRSDLSPLYTSPFEPVPPPLSGLPPQRIASPPRIPTSSPPKYESDVKQAPVNEEEALALAIALSEKESKEHSGKVSKEQEDLARAIKESMRHASYFDMPVPSAEAGPSTFRSTTSPLSFPTPSPVPEPSASSHMSHAPPYTNHPSASRPASKVPSPLTYPTQSSIDDDAAFAHRLAEEEERAAAAGPSNPRPEPPVLPCVKPETTATPAPAPAPSPNSRRRHRPRLSVDESEPPPPLYHHVVSSVQAPVPAKISPTSPNNGSSLGRSSSASAVIPSNSRLSPVPGNDERPNGGRSQSLDTVPSSSNSTRLSPSIPTTNPSSLPTLEESPLGQSPSSPLPPPNANSFIDQKLLNGVCESFHTARICWSVVDDFDPLTLKHSVSALLRSPVSRQRLKAGFQMLYLYPLGGLYRFTSRHRIGVIF